MLLLKSDPSGPSIQVQMRISTPLPGRVSGLLTETGGTYDKLHLHRMGYFRRLMSTNEEIRDNLRPLLKLCREHVDPSIRMDRALLKSLERDPLLSERLRRLRTVPVLARSRL